MRVALISDIHGNWDGFEAVLRDIESRHVDKIICLGDLVEGGDRNDAVVEFIKNNNIATVRGNHDEINDCSLKQDNQNWLNHLPESIIEEDVIFTHISPRPRRRSIDNSIEAWNVFNGANFRLGFVGHIHFSVMFGNTIADRVNEFGRKFMDVEELLRRYAVGQWNFADIDLSDADMSGVDLSQIFLAGANLRGANLRGANLSMASLSRADLTKADLSDASLKRTRLDSAEIVDANLSRANLKDADLIGANLKRANLSGANLFNATLYRANLENALLVGADLSQTDLGNACFYNADLTNANLTDAVSGYVSGAIFCNTIMPDGSIESNGC